PPTSASVCMSAFALEDGLVYHTYSAFARGLDGLWGMYQWLDRAPKGRNEKGGYWLRHRDKYGDNIGGGGEKPKTPPVSSGWSKARVSLRRRTTALPENLDGVLRGGAPAGRRR